jgi:hypothetical protein
MGLPYYDKDPHGKNWIVAENGDVVALDFTDKGDTDQCIQLAKLTEHTSLFEGDYATRERVLDAYRAECRSIEPRHLFEGVLAATPIVAFNAYYYSSLGRADPQMTRNYVTNALRAIDHGTIELGWSTTKVATVTRLLHAVQEISSPL